MSERNKWYWVLHDVSARNAGLHVRANPIVNELKLFCAVFIVSIDDVVTMMMTGKIPDEVAGFVFAKPSDSRTALLITELSANGYPIVIDLFDNYFSFSKWASQSGVPYLWMQNLYLADAVIVSSPVIEDRIRYLKPNTSLISVCDPLPWHKCSESSSFKNGLKKWQNEPSKRKLLWFGIGSNPWYQAGLVDLINWLPLIKKLYATRPVRTEIELVICSNLIANVLNVVMQYQQIGIPTRFVAWSQENCATELETAHCVLLPTGASEFSRSKTHNRLSEAINNCCIVFTTPLGPYENFIGGAVQTTLQNIQRLLFCTDALAINQALEQTVSTLEKYHPFTKQINNLGKQLIQLGTKYPGSLVRTTVFRAVIIGFQTPGAIAKMARKARYLIVGYSFNQVLVTYDIYLQSVDPKSQVALITCSDFGKQALTSMGLHLTQCDEEGLFSLPLPVECIDASEKLSLYYQLDNGHKSISTYINKLSVIILISLLGREKSNIFLADNSGVCWPSYIKAYANYLTKPVQKLESMWKKTYEMQ